MKKQAFPILLAVTGVFLAFTIGLFIGRNTGRGDIQVSHVPAAPMHADKAPESSAPEETTPPETVSFPLNINSASQSELTALPGIGEVLARQILDYRTQYGPFSHPEELLSVPGIGTGKLEAILDLITTEGGIS